MRPALAGAAAALAWAAAEPFDRSVFRNDYSDVAMLGKLLTRSRAWPLAGLAIHAANGAIFGIAFGQVLKRTQTPPRRLALQVALLEHTLLYPLAYIVDRRHPARGQPGVAPVFNLRGFAQETARHTLFGAMLGRLTAR